MCFSVSCFFIARVPLDTRFFGRNSLTCDFYLLYKKPLHSLDFWGRLISHGGAEHVSQFLARYEPSVVRVVSEITVALPGAVPVIRPFRSTTLAAAYQLDDDERQQREVHDGHGSPVPGLKSSLHLHLASSDVLWRGHPVPGLHAS